MTNDRYEKMVKELERFLDFSKIDFTDSNSIMRIVKKPLEEARNEQRSNEGPDGND